MSYANMSDAELTAAYNDSKNPFEAALQAEGVSGKLANVARSIYAQESGGGRNTKTSNAGAVGGMQIIPSTFKSVADSGWDINDPVLNARAGIRYLKQLDKQSGGVPELTAAGYYGGPGGMEKARKGVAVSDPRNPNAPNTLQYGQQVAARLPRESRPVADALNAAAGAVMGSANAATPSSTLNFSDMTDAQLTQAYAASKALAAPKAELSTGRRILTALGDNAQAVGRGYRDLTAGVLRGTGSIGATLLTPYDMLAGNTKSVGNPERRQAMDDALSGMGVDTDSLAYGGGKLAGEVAGTAGAGSVVAKPLQLAAQYGGRAAPALDALATAVGSGGLKTGADLSTLANLATRTAGGAVSGGATAGLVAPDTASTGALIGGALPGVALAAGAGGRALRNSVAGRVAPEVAALAEKAKALGIDIPADRLVSSKPLDALASGLRYTPFSGRQAAEDRMAAQLDAAVSRTFGQTGSNVNKALSQAQAKLGGEFERTLRENTVNLDKNMLEGLAAVYNDAERNLGADALKPIAGAIDELISKAPNGVIEGQAAYNIKKNLDRISARNTNEAYHAKDLRGVLMDALDRSLGPDKAAAFAQTRKEYGAMLTIEKLAPNGADTTLSAARLGNMRNLKNPELQDIADIAAQFVKQRESQHGGAQRALTAVAGGALVGLPGLAAAAAAGRTANTALNSSTLKKLLLNAPQTAAQPGQLTQGLYRALPAAAPLALQQ